MLLCANFFFAEQPDGFALSERTAGILKKNGYEAERLPLINAWSDDFPYNIALDFPSETEGAETLLVAAKQEDLLRHERFFLQLLEYVAANEFPFSTRILFTAGDEQKIKGNEKMTGTEIFCRSIEGAQNMSALLLDFSGGRKALVTAGSEGEISPFSLTKPLCDALDRNGCDYSITGGVFISLYTLAVLKSDARLHSFLSRQIPALLFSMSAREEGGGSMRQLSAVKDFLSGLDLAQSGEWSRHYIPLKIAGKHFWISEIIILYCVLVFTAAGLFIIADFVFVFRKRSRYLAEIKARAIKSLYLVFATAVVLTLGFTAGQAMAFVLRNSGFRNPMILYFIKLLPALLIISFIYIAELRLHRGLPVYIYEYILSISAFFNILFFSFFEISLFFLFALEYLIVSISRTVKRTLLLYFFMILTVLPFIPLLYSIMVYSDMEKINELLFCSPPYNLALAFALIPFNLVWLRILERRNSKAGSARNLAVRYAAAIFSCIAGLAIFSGAVTFLLDKLFFENVEPIQMKARIVPAPENERTSVNIYDSDYYGGKIRHVEIKFLEDAERCSITVRAEKGNPVYFSVYESENTAEGRKFMIPDRPPREMSIIYTPDESEKSEILIESFFMDGMDGRTCLEEKFSFAVDE